MIVTFAGNLGKDAEVFEKNEKKMLRFNVADTNWSKGESKTVWLTCFYHNAEFAKYLKKGKQVMVTGDLSVAVNSYNKEQPTVDLTVHVHSLKLLGSKDDGQQQG